MPCAIESRKLNVTDLRASVYLVLPDLHLPDFAHSLQAPNLMRVNTTVKRSTEPSMKYVASRYEAEDPTCMACPASTESDFRIMALRFIFVFKSVSLECVTMEAS